VDDFVFGVGADAERTALLKTLELVRHIFSNDGTGTNPCWGALAA
jgi:hypothetical protein